MSSLAWLMPARSVGKSQRGRTVIAIVDDDESVRHATKRLVRSLGMEADTFASGEGFIEFIDATPSNRFDCLILDLQTRGLNGLEVQERLKARDYQPPIIFLTACAEAKIRERALKGGAIAFLQKPFAAEILIKSLRAAL
jgi:FixJ family two-component response regulator